MCTHRHWWCCHHHIPAEHELLADLIHIQSYISMLHYPHQRRCGEFHLRLILIWLHMARSLRDPSLKGKSCSQATRNTTVICGEGEVIIWQVQRQKRAIINGGWRFCSVTSLGTCVDGQLPESFKWALVNIKMSIILFLSSMKSCSWESLLSSVSQLHISLPKGQDLQHQVCEQYWCPQRGCQGIQFRFPT